MNFKKLFLFGLLIVSGITKTSESVHLSLPFSSISSFLNYFKIAVFSNKNFTINENELSKLITQGKIIKWGALAVSALATYGLITARATARNMESPKNLLFLTGATLGVLGIYTLGVLGIYTYAQLTKTRTFSKVK